MSLHRACRTRRTPVALTGLLTFATYVGLGLVTAQPGGLATALADTSCPGGAVFNVVAHPDDDLLFLSPDLLSSIQTPGVCVRTLVLTAAEGGSVLNYAKERERGLMAAYAEMAGLPNSWTQTDAGLTGRPVPLWTLTGSQVSIEFLRLPDGNEDGSGFPAYNFQSMQKLYQGQIPSIQAIDGSASYNKGDLTNAIQTLMTRFGATVVRTQNYVGPFGDDDHSDHHAAAYFTRDASRKDTFLHTLTSYQDYFIKVEPVNLTAAQVTAKQNAFMTYAAFDDARCSPSGPCDPSMFQNINYGEWWSRQYTLASATDGQNHPPVANPGPAQTVTPTASVTLNGSASSDPDNQPLTYSWNQTSGPLVSNLQGANTATPTFTAPLKTGGVGFQLTVTDPLGASNSKGVTINVANSPPKANAGPDQTVRPLALVTLDGSASTDPQGQPLTYLWKQTSGPTVSLSDPTAVKPTFVAPLKAGPVGLSLTVTDPFGLTNSNGVNINVVNHAPAANAGPGQTVPAGSTVTLDGSRSTDPDGDPLTYMWTQTAGTSVTLSDPTAVKPTFTAPMVGGAVTFVLTVTDPYSLSATSKVSINVSPPPK